MGHVEVAALCAKPATHTRLTVDFELGTGFSLENPVDHFLNFFSGQAGHPVLKPGVRYDSVSYVTHYLYLALL